MNIVPERLIAAKVYGESSELIGIADITLPNIENMTETISGAGIAGEIDSPTLGHFSAMTLGMTFRTMNKSMFEFAKAKSHDLDIRAAQQQYDAGNGEYNVQPVRVFVRGLPKNINLGNANTGQTTESAIELEVVYLKVTVDDKVQLEIDKFNFVFNVGGTDYLQAVRSALGMN